MKLEGPILGYDVDDKEIIQPKGWVYTMAFIFCSDCKGTISSIGGPRFGSRCVPCYLKTGHTYVDTDNESIDKN